MHHARDQPTIRRHRATQTQDRRHSRGPTPTRPRHTRSHRPRPTPNQSRRSHPQNQSRRRMNGYGFITDAPDGWSEYWAPTGETLDDSDIPIYELVYRIAPLSNHLAWRRPID